MKSPIDGPAFRPEGAATDLRTDCAMGVMAKSPRVGYSKTRLCPPLRPEQAARLSAAFLGDTRSGGLLWVTSRPNPGTAKGPISTRASRAHFLGAFRSWRITHGTRLVPMLLVD